MTGVFCWQKMFVEIASMISSGIDFILVKFEVEWAIEEQSLMKGPGMNDTPGFVAVQPELFPF